MIRALIVDDEPLAREGVRASLKDESDVTIVGEGVDGPDAVRLIDELRPDLVFLDVKMPGCDGFQVLEETSSRHLPLVVFLTAFDQHALRAFEIDALDFLVKPVLETRIRGALDRARRELARNELGDLRRRLAALLDAREGTEQPVSAPLRRFVIRRKDRFLIVRAEEIDWISAAGNYVELHVGSRTHSYRATLTEIESRLAPGCFARTHRSTLVNLERIRRIAGESHGDCEIELDSGAVLRMSRRYRHNVLDSGRRRD